MPFRDLFGSPRDQPYADSDPRNPKNYYKVQHDKRKADEAKQDRRMSEADAKGELKSNGRDIPGVISHNDSLYFATASGWTHAERWRPSQEDEAERLRRMGHGDAVVTGSGVGDGSKGGGDYGDRGSGVEHIKGNEGKKNVGDKIRSFIFGAAGVTKE